MGVTTPSPRIGYCFDLAKLREAEANLMRSAHAPNTFKAYAAAWKAFCDWCRESQRGDPLPATPGQVREFVTWSSQIRKPPSKPQTICLAAAAIRHHHLRADFPSPVDQSVAVVLTAIRRQAARNGARAEEAGKKHLTIEQLKKICRSLGRSPQDVRDRAMILLGFASALRRSEMARLQAMQRLAAKDPASAPSRSLVNLAKVIKRN